MSKDALLKEIKFQFLKVSDEQTVTKCIPPLILDEISTSIPFAQAEALAVGTKNIPLEHASIA